VSRATAPPVPVELVVVDAAHRTRR
jgi:hypothetical protein